MTKEKIGELEEIYVKVKKYQLGYTIALINAIGGMSVGIYGLVTKDDVFMRVGVAMALWACAYHFGQTEAKNQFKKVSELEKKLK